MRGVLSRSARLHIRLSGGSLGSDASVSPSYNTGSAPHRPNLSELILFSVSPASVSRLGASVYLQLYRSSLGVPRPVHSVPLWYGCARAARQSEEAWASFHVRSSACDSTYSTCSRHNMFTRVWTRVFIMHMSLRARSCALRHVCAKGCAGGYWSPFREMGSYALSPWRGERQKGGVPSMGPPCLQCSEQVARPRSAAMP